MACYRDEYTETDATGQMTRTAQYDVDPRYGSRFKAAFRLVYRAMQAVTSSNVASIGYDEVSQTLTVAFQNNSVYDYYQVRKPCYQALMAAQSKGQFLHR